MAMAVNLTAGRLTTSQLETILGKAIQDPKLAGQLQNDPEGALRAMGYAPHPEEVAFFKSLSTGGFGTAAAELNGKDPQHYASEA